MVQGGFPPTPTPVGMALMALRTESSPKSIVGPIWPLVFLSWLTDTDITEVAFDCFSHQGQ